FFFQAEDGIRDFHVTGVQTCALPISNAEQAAFRPVYSRTDLAVEDLARRLDQIRERVYSPGQRRVFGTTITPQHLTAHAYQKARSEERRVGKECRSRWAP